MRYLLVLFFSYCFSFLAIAQQEKRPEFYDDSTLEQQTISDDDLQTYKADKDFDYTETKKEDSFLDKAMRWLRNILRKFWEAIFGVGTAEGFLFFMLRILPYILLAVLLFFLIKFFLKVNSNRLIGKDQEKGQVNYSEEEQIIKNEDINALIAEAVKQQNYRLAIRYYYLLALKNLTEKDKIEWQPQKTNADYINELHQTPIQPDFENITKIYDYVWYGEFNVDILKFESLKLPFESLNKSITVE